MMTRRERVTDDVRWSRAHHPVSDRVHFALAISYCLVVPFFRLPEGPLLIAMFITAVLRLPQTYRLVPILLRDPTIWLLALWATFTIWSRSWSLDPEQGSDELRALRAIVLPFALFPLLDRVRWLCAALIVGTLLQNVAQACAYASLFGATAPYGRTGGLHHTIMAGAWFAVALAWMISATMWFRGRWRVIMAAGLCAPFFGMLATGSRGVWLAALIGLPMGFAIRSVIDRAHRPSPRTWLIAAGVTALTMLLASPLAAPRVRAAVQEIHQVQADDVYWTSVGLRIGYWQWSIDAWLDAPLRGHGVGSFRSALAQVDDYQRVRAENAGRESRLRYIERDHAHSSLLHMLVGTGVVGVLPFAALILLLLIRSARDPDDHPFARAQLAAMLTWTIGSVFDSYHLTGHAFAILILLTTFVMRYRPSPARRRGD